jgi:hypothetical protein
MKKDRIKRIFLYSIYELDAVKDFLEGMALKGWMLEKVKGNALFYFKSCTPQKLPYSIEVLSRASQMDVKETKRNSDYVYYCEAAGWRFITSQGKIQIFCTDRDDVPPIETDQELKLSGLKKCVFQQELLCTVLLLLSLLFCVAEIIFFLPLILMNYWGSTIFLFSFFMLTSCCIYKAIAYRLWFKRAKASLKASNPIEFYGTRHRNAWIYALTASSIAWFLFGIVYYALYYETFWWIIASISFTLICMAVYKAFQKKMPSASYSSPKGLPIVLATAACLAASLLAITVKLSKLPCNPPLTFDNLGIETDYKFTSGCRYTGNFLVQRAEAYDHFGDGWSRNDLMDLNRPYMHYEVYKTSLPWLQENIIENLYIKPMKSLSFKEIDIPSFRADTVYYAPYENSSLNIYILKYADSVVVLNVNFGKIEGELAARISDRLSGSKLFTGNNTDI